MYLKPKFGWQIKPPSGATEMRVDKKQEVVIASLLRIGQELPRPD